MIIVRVATVPALSEGMRFGITFVKVCAAGAAAFVIEDLVEPVARRPRHTDSLLSA